MKFYDRENELSVLQRIEADSLNSASFCVLTGRRRVGKTSLVTKALEGKKWAYLFVSKDSESVLAGKFQEELSKQLGIHIYGHPKKFSEVFSVIMQESQRRHFSIVIDEFQTLYKINPAIFSEMQDLWDRHHTTSKLNLVVTGSMQSLMNRIFEDNGEPLYGRPTSKMILLPFETDVLKEILSEHNPNAAAEDLLCLYMITGGVAKYVELLMDAGCCTKKKMLDYVFRPDSYFLTEGRDMVSQEFSDDSATYFSILQLIASGHTRRKEIDGAIQKDTGTFLQNLEKNFHLIKRMHPILSNASGKTTSYRIKDQFLQFWFRFICPYQALIERRQMALLRENTEKGYDGFSGRILEQYFQQKYMETGRYTITGSWWDRTYENEIDLVALNEFDKTGIIGTIKRNPQKTDLNRLRESFLRMPKNVFGEYDISIVGLSLQDM